MSISATAILAAGLVAPWSALGQDTAAPKAANPALAARFDQLIKEYEATFRKYESFYKGASEIAPEDRAKALAVLPDYAALVRKIVAIAAESPTDPAVRDALLWIVDQPGRADDRGSRAGEWAQAAHWLAARFGDDPEAIRVGLGLGHAPASPYRDHLLLTFVTSAKSRESKGLARLALAQYLQRKALFVEHARSRATDGPVTYTVDELVRADGTTYSATATETPQEYAYILHLKQCDASDIRAEAERLFEEVVAEYADIPHITSGDRRLERLLADPNADWYGSPLTPEGRAKIQNGIERRRSTLGAVAEARLDDLHNLAVGKLAPEIEGTDLDGNPLKLSDFRGKIVAISFWGGWCGPCVREIPRERDLIERMKGRPFVFLGVNTDETAEEARAAIAKHGVTWPNWHDGPAGQGPIVQRYHIPSYPTVYVVDAEGNIRDKKIRGTRLEELVEQLVSEVETKGK